MREATRNKWWKYKFMKSSKMLSPYIPETKMMNHSSIRNLLEKYKHIIIKPVKGSRGIGVIQLSYHGNDTYTLHYEKMRHTIRGKQQAKAFLNRCLMRKYLQRHGYVVQPSISRATIGHRPFDLRVIVQRRINSGQWKVTAKIAKVAGNGYIVSNISRSNGDVLPVHTAIERSSIRHLNTNDIQARIDKIAILSAQRLSTFFKGHRIYGLDMGIDKDGRVWVIEANLFPLMSHFRKLKDPTMYRRIMVYKRDGSPPSYDYSHEESSSSISMFDYDVD